MENKNEEMQLEEVERIRDEVRSFKGIEYRLVLCGVRKGAETLESTPESKDDEQWWCVEYTDKSKRLALSSFRGCLYYDSRFMTGYRLMDKYNHCELQAIGMISYLENEFLGKQGIWIWNAVKQYAYCVWKLFFKMIKFKFEKRFSKKNEVEQALAKQLSEKK
jgi:hypothetical protein